MLSGEEGITLADDLDDGFVDIFVDDITGYIMTLGLHREGNVTRAYC
jgi:hypothetical protein